MHDHISIGFDSPNPRNTMTTNIQNPHRIRKTTHKNMFHSVPRHPSSPSLKPNQPHKLQSPAIAIPYKPSPPRLPRYLSLSLTHTPLNTSSILGVKCSATTTGSSISSESETLDDWEGCLFPAAAMRYGEVVHFSHPQHRLRLEHHDTPFRCDGCREVGIGARFRCPYPGCDHDLHRQCALPLSPPPPPLRHPFYPRCAFVFLPRAPGVPGSRYCNACGRDVAGYVYHCRACGFDLHPCCAALPHALDAGGGVRLRLHPDSRAAGAAACHRCGHRGRSWSYRSQCGSFSLHVACVMDMLVESWHSVGRHKSGGGRNVYDGGMLVPGAGGYRVPAIRGAAKSAHVSRGGYSTWGRKKGKVKRCCEIAGFAGQVVISAVLGDPTALIAGVIGSLIAR